VPPQEAQSGLFAALRDITAVLAGLAALVYLTGGLALQLRLGAGGVPSSVAVPQLPREFLISLGLLIVAPAVALGVVLGHITHSAKVGIAMALLGYLVIGWLVVGKNPFPAKVCLAGGGEVTGVFIGETDARTYLADLGGEHPRRIISIPQSRVEGVAVGGQTPQLEELRCPAHGPPVRNG
jgi:hypothetical protein